MVKLFLNQPKRFLHLDVVSQIMIGQLGQIF